MFADVGFVESFIPLREWDLPKMKSKKKRSEKFEKSSTNAESYRCLPYPRRGLFSSGPFHTHRRSACLGPPLPR
ncbi:hypothetical protein BD310DRAFT_925251, partial [Dichomitus squalens]